MSGARFSIRSNRHLDDLYLVGHPRTGHKHPLEAAHRSYALPLRRILGGAWQITGHPTQHLQLFLDAQDRLSAGQQEQPAVRGIPIVLKRLKSQNGMWQKLRTQIHVLTDQSEPPVLRN
ncbi:MULTISPECIES: hypothetical protein [Alphaproteobacteria]|uniref:hypothetical protein n=1 Tax=Alphaproteobacteria TaxID=28211 RepID=UPI0014798328|nr:MULTISPECIES: hypothetical protein [Alphaproteobacteria]